MKLQLEHLKPEVDKLQKHYGSTKHYAIYGAGCLKNPQNLFLFMNPTAKNYSAVFSWQGLRAPWIGTKNIWKMFFALGFLEKDIFDSTQNNNRAAWNEKFVNVLYSSLSKKSIYITNLAKCTQIDARALKNEVFRNYLRNTLEEIYLINPDHIISFGNQVSSILLNKNIKVSEYQETNSEILTIKDKKFKVYPVYYPVGQGMRNMPKAIKRIKAIVT
ncbi:MAG: uracil-DNA glycosylase family protein [Candidatus Buchananbacteria bacterium]